MLRQAFALGLGLLLAVLAWVPAGRAALVVKYEYDAINYLPTSQGWSGPPIYPGISATNNTTDRSLTLGDATTATAAAISKALTPADYAGDWTLTAVLRADWADNYADIGFSVAMGGPQWNIWVSGNGDNKIRTLHSVAQNSFDLATVPTAQTAFHTYQLMGHGNVARPELWIDGQPTGQLAGDGYGNPGNTIFFNGWTSTGQSVSNWRLVRFDTGFYSLYVPEPVTLALWALAGLVLVRRPR